MPSEIEKYENIISSLTASTVAQIDGVADLSIDTGVVGRFFKSQGNSVQVTLTEKKDAMIDVSFKAYYGYKIPDLAYRIQSAVIEKVEAATPYKVKAVNINVVGVVFK
ncbi:MAG: Asp23/Gls24 family envelope stress response protein [Clostridia bacterium]|nr:Asp23/Gls24 family envelope stress response protein [Clostridia bacterium]